MTLTITTLALGFCHTIAQRAGAQNILKACHHLSNIGFNEVLTHIHLSLKSSN